MPKKQIGKKIDEQGNLTDLGYTVTQEEINNWNNKVDKDSYQEITGQKVFSKPIRTGNANSENDFRIGTEIDQSGVITCKNDMDGANFRTIVKIPTIKDTRIDINLPQKSGTIATTDDIPTNNNQLTNGAEYINKDVNNLTNYTLATNTASSIEMSIDNSTYVVSLKLKNAEGTQLGETQTIDLPLESVVVNGAYDSTTKEVILTLDNGNEIRFSVADLVSGLATTTDLANYVPTSRTVNGKALSSNISLGNKDVGALPDYTLTITHQSAGNPRMVKFASVNYSSKATCFKMAAMTCHDNGVSYQFLTDMLISVTTAGKVTANIYKFAQSSIGSVDGVARYTGDVFYVNDTTNKIVDFYILCGQWSASQFTPVTKVGSTTIANVTQYSGSATYYSSGTKEWASGCGTTYARSNEIPTKTSELENDSNFATTSDLNNYLPLSGGTVSGNITFPFGKGLYTADGKNLLICYADKNLYVGEKDKKFYVNGVEDRPLYNCPKGIYELALLSDCPTQQEKEFLTSEYNKVVNLLDIPDKSSTITNGIEYSISKGVITINGTTNIDFGLNIPINTIPSGTYSYNDFRSTSKDILTGITDSNYHYIIYGQNENDGRQTITTSSNGAFFRLWFNSNTSFINFKISPMLITGTIIPSTHYEYNGSIVHEKDLPQIIWEGSLKIGSYINLDFTKYKKLYVYSRRNMMQIMSTINLLSTDTGFSGVCFMADEGEANKYLIIHCYIINGDRNTLTFSKGGYCYLSTSETADFVSELSTSVNEAYKIEGVLKDE